MVTQEAETIRDLFILASTIGGIGGLYYIGYNVSRVASELKNYYRELRKIKEHLTKEDGGLEGEVEDK